mmetsp:Transcript_20586/g.49500  ORF Transcript_20586/g.49500 Transcript_20586/m.49500 type:complete len:211 (-) Transcript_20586:648-1280(-)|eukprot:CAMPEP_0181115772 /NCGR_PEP_ID=MMETSP1071-20121207/21604_1 /TAXON_ID=35127 /ORGANISM="Thalassiosira sp., Strain NH16" /LENGTH=210 /DNA_ID=CAMNT_0023199989 /DNA_START=736 /DNA_END=1368 /DNA_ORIENTATION=+
MSANASPTMMMPNVHFFDFNDEVNPIKHPDRFHVLWQLDVSRPPQRKSDGLEEWKGIFEGDLVLFPSLLSGGEEFEAVRFVGPKMTKLAPEGDVDEVLPLLTAGIEYPEFPALIVSMAEERGISLRELYEDHFNTILQSQPPKLSLFDILGRDEGAYAEFWEDVPVARRRRPPSGSPWRFSLGECVWTKTLVGRSLTGGAPPDQNRQEEL